MTATQDGPLGPGPTPAACTLLAGHLPAGLALLVTPPPTLSSSASSPTQLAAGDTASGSAWPLVNSAWATGVWPPCAQGDSLG